MKRVLILVTELNRGGIELSLLNYIKQLVTSTVADSQTCVNCGCADGEHENCRCRNENNTTQTSQFPSRLPPQLRGQFQIDILLNRAKHGELSCEFERLGCNIYNTSSISPRDMFSKNNNFTQELRSFLQSKVCEFGTYDIIHSHLEEKSAFLLECLLQSPELMPKQCLIVQSHNYYNVSVIHPKSVLRAILANRTRKAIAMIHKMNYSSVKCIAVSDIAGKWLFGNTNFEIVHNPIDLEDYKYSEKSRTKWRTYFCEKLGISADSFVIGAVGRLVDQKNFAYLIDVAQEILKNQTQASIDAKLTNDFHIIICGKGSEEAKLLRKINKSGLQKNVHILYVNNDINEIYSAFDLLAVPSKHEGFGNVVIEGLASGLPIVASKNVPATSLLANQNTLKHLIFVNYITMNNINKWIENFKTINLQTHNEDGRSNSEEIFSTLEPYKTENAYFEMMQIWGK